MAARIRAARAGDFDALVQLTRRAVQSFGEISEDLYAHPDAFRVTMDHIGAGHVLIADVEDAIAGFAIWFPIGDLTAQLEGILVDPCFRGSGIGAGLMRAVYDAVTAEGLKNLLVAAIPEAAEFYRRCGFVRTGATSTPLGPALTMMKEIALP